MSIALDFANWFDSVSEVVDQQHVALAAQRPADGSQEFAAWGKRMIQLTDQFGDLVGAAMALRNVDAQSAMASIAPQLEAINGSTKDAQKVIAEIGDINNALKLVAAFVDVAASVAAVVANPVSGAAGLVKSGKALLAALKPFKK
jgi:hypothetical protein